jgi:hypothetical protein
MANEIEKRISNYAMRAKVDWARSAVVTTADDAEWTDYEVFGVDRLGRPPLLGRWLDERAEEAEYIKASKVKKP